MLFRHSPPTLSEKIGISRFPSYWQRRAYKARCRGVRVSAGRAYKARLQESAVGWRAYKARLQGSAVGWRAYKARLP